MILIYGGTSMDTTFRNCYNCKYLNYWVTNEKGIQDRNPMLFTCTHEKTQGPHLELARGCEKYKEVDPELAEKFPM